MFLPWLPSQNGDVSVMQKKRRICNLFKVQPIRSGEREILGSFPGRDIPKSFKMVLAAPRLALRLTG